MKTVAASGVKGVTKLVMASHAGMTGEEFEQEVSKWFTTNKNSYLDRLYKECIYQPQLELLAY